MLKTLDPITADIVRYALSHCHTFEEVREAMQELDFGPSTVIPARYYDLMLEVYRRSLSPTDKGREGKYKETVYRVHNNRAKWMYYREFHAHRIDRADLSYKQMGEQIENKSSAGDWFRGNVDSWDAMFRLYYRKAGLVRWAVDKQDVHFEILCTWPELLDYLAGYNDKGLTTWVKAELKASDRGDWYIGEMQWFMTSARKCQYLIDCPFNRMPGYDLKELRKSSK